MTMGEREVGVGERRLRRERIHRKERSREREEKNRFKNGPGSHPIIGILASSYRFLRVT
jgi:hypothetical protein